MKKNALLVLVLVLIMAIISGCTKNDADTLTGNEQKEEKIAVSVAKSKKENIIISSSLSGKLSGIEDVMITPELSFPAKVMSVKVALGDRVQKGQVLFTLDDENVRKQVEQAQAAYDAVAANLSSSEEKIENAKLNFERTKQLFEAGAVSQQTYEQAQLAASDKALDGLRAQLNQTKVSLDQARSQLEKTTIKSPLEGYVAVVNVKESEFATNAQPSMRIVNIDKLKVNVGVSEQLINKLHKGQTVEVKVQAATEEAFTGKIIAISPMADQRTQVYPVEIEIENKNGLIKAGMFAEIIFDIEKRESVLAIPSQALKKRDEKHYVYTVEGDMVKIKEVKIGLDNGTLVEIVEGITEKDDVIIKGQDYVEDGSKVNVVRGDQ